MGAGTISWRSWILAGYGHEAFFIHSFRIASWSLCRLVNKYNDKKTGSLVMNCRESSI
ncbi:Bgt-20334 [Blumeria graminis f. sp. tritici]|uniref:Bgt-20334 n=2 Tax=Blumeria graminis f. sp. tritici TaxID=62690 RepID=A0A381L2M2_BLUGR|nr:Bgt-20334 [Blumeria graminis f. sp. tritici]